MPNFSIWMIALIVILILIVFYGIRVYNNLVSAREFVRNSMGNIAAQVESRWDAVSSLIGAAKHYAGHESETLVQLTAQRSPVNRDSSARDVERDDALFSQAMTQIQAVAEAYPELKADGIYVRAMDGIDSYENNVRSARMVYNDTVTRLNRMIQQFPSSIVANMAGFTQEEYFQNSDNKQDMPSWT